MSSVPIPRDSVAYEINGVGSNNPFPTIPGNPTPASPFRNMQQVVTYHNNNNLLSKQVYIQVTGNFTDSTITINFPFIMTATLYLFVFARTWTINGDLIIDFRNTIRKPYAYTSNDINVIFNSLIVERDAGSDTQVWISKGQNTNIENRNNSNYGIIVPTDTTLTLSNIIIDKPIKVEGTLNIIDGEAKLYNNSEAAIEIESTGKVNISNEKIEYFNRLQDSALFEGSGSLDSERSKYLSDTPFVFHRTTSNNIFHNFDILDVPNGTVDDNVANTKIKYDSVILLKNTKSLINKNKANYVFTTSEGEVYTSKSNDSDDIILNVRNKREYSYVINDIKYNVLNFENIEKLNLRFDTLPVTFNLKINLINVNKIKIIGYISAAAKESLLRNRVTSLHYNNVDNLWVLQNN
ncbi:Putative phospholipase D-like protein [Orpheovirus IHUMI-LCC2]|uniref:Phospholipase D-like protein n=1 Tax=Orpheovirus IHUMI-LCC2 TaxID=2023057 RepID=A0A2I2L5C4_9VIRU|nr:Putative phospholipase D-like protein [Orpheovirus IHUMI-LCC2]SNW62727.1 Putative phospholipase D-like protein [Orpheovirus IHUMI-LCC2]